jgi:hypothetical protein
MQHVLEILRCQNLRARKPASKRSRLLPRSERSLISARMACFRCAMTSSRLLMNWVFNCFRELSDLRSRSTEQPQKLKEASASVVKGVSHETRR